MTEQERYPVARLREGLLKRWDGDDYVILRYLPRSRTGGVYDVSSQLLIDFKNGAADAEKLMAALALTALRGLAPELRDRRKAAYLVPLPSHAAGRTTGPCYRLAERLASQVDWLEYLPALVRHTSVAKSATSGPGERPTRVDHKASMRCVGPPLRIRDQSIIMLDDVITAGETSAAARELLSEATECRTVIGFFLARTMQA